MPAFDFVLAGRYRLVAPLGEGGMAAVYRGRDLRLNREVAVKVLHESLTRDPEFLHRFEREAQYLASLSHPHIVPVYDVGEEKGTHFIIMEYVRGRTLADLLRTDGKLAPGRAIEVMRQALDALAYAHSRGLVHRDVKPHNVLLTADGTARLSDFGIAHLADGSGTQTAAILGSAHYISPEQSRGEGATALSDIYSSGVMLYEMLAGRPPFDAPNALAIAHHHLHSPPEPLRNLLPTIDPALDAAVSRALSKDPADRFGDAQAFAAALPSEGDPPDHTAIQPLVLPAQTSSRHQGPETARPLERMVMRRSARKSYILAALLAVALAMAWYAASLPVWSKALPAYPSAPYGLVPAALLLFFLLSWFSTRSWVYTLDESVAVVQWGVVGHHRFGVPIRQIVWLELKQSPFDRVLGVGTVELCARDDQGAERRLVLEDLAHPRLAYEDLTRLLGRAAHRRERQEKPEADS